MEDIKVTSTIDLKTYYNISLLVFYKLRTIIIMLVFVVAISYFALTDSYTDWESYGYVFILMFIYGAIFPATIYFACRKNMKRTPFLNETIYYQLNKERIELRGQTVNSSSSWQYVSKMIEREKYFLLMTSVRNFYYLPKDGFESKERIIDLKNMIKEKGIKMTYN